MRGWVVALLGVVAVGCGKGAPVAADGAMGLDAGADADPCAGQVASTVTIGPPHRIATAPSQPAAASPVGLAWSGDHALVAFYDDDIVGQWLGGVHAMRLDALGNRTDPTPIVVGGNQPGFSIGIDPPKVAAQPAGGWVVAYEAGGVNSAAVVEASGVVKASAALSNVSGLLQALIEGTSAVWALTSTGQRISIAADGTIGAPIAIAPPTSSATLWMATVGAASGLLIYVDAGATIGVDTDGDAASLGTTHALGAGFPVAAPVTRGSDHAVLMGSASMPQLVIVRGGSVVTGPTFSAPWTTTAPTLGATATGYVVMGSTDSALWSQALDADGAPVGQPELVAMDPVARPAVTTTSSGGALAAWTAYGTQTSDTAVRTWLAGAAPAAPTTAWVLPRHYSPETLSVVSGPSGALAIFDGGNAQVLDTSAQPVGSPIPLQLYSIGRAVAIPDGYWVFGIPFGGATQPDLLTIGLDGTVRSRTSIPLPAAQPSDAAWSGSGGLLVSSNQVLAVDAKGAPLSPPVAIGAPGREVTLHAASDGAILATLDMGGYRQAERLAPDGHPIDPAPILLWQSNAQIDDSWSCGPSCWMLWSGSFGTRVHLVNGAPRSDLAFPWPSSLALTSLTTDGAGCVAVSAATGTSSSDVQVLLLRADGSPVAGPIELPLVPFGSLNMFTTSTSRFWLGYAANAGSAGGPPGLFVNELLLGP